MTSANRERERAGGVEDTRSLTVAVRQNIGEVHMSRFTRFAAVVLGGAGVLLTPAPAPAQWMGGSPWMGGNPWTSGKDEGRPPSQWFPRFQ